MPAGEYPESDGKPMAETGIHVDCMTDLFKMLRGFFLMAPDVYVGANMFLYYQEGDPRKVVAPDVFVVLGVSSRDERNTWKVWVEGKAPDVIFELTSKSTRKEDLVEKKGLYERLGVREYFLFDPQREYLQPSLWGYRLAGKEYVRLEGEVLQSEVLGLVLRVEEGQLRLYDRATGGRILTPIEEMEARQIAEVRAEQAEVRAEQETVARQEVEAELERLKAELERLRRR